MSLANFAYFPVPPKGNLISIILSTLIIYIS
jgi:hypothetical protein